MSSYPYKVIRTYSEEETIEEYEAYGGEWHYILGGILGTLSDLRFDRKARHLFEDYEVITYEKREYVDPNNPNLGPWYETVETGREKRTRVLRGLNSLN